ncbi:MAG: RIP metalloprotease RseP [Candidatus Zixiibacteriota bacterium]|nr:MAG: RIP metalloprotease RseP [candidate division Zixibacteria bacterium]
MTTILSFIFVLGVLVFIHELGHFLVAKRVGIRVERFSLGFPPYIFQRQKGETVYSIGVIPLGGFVKMAGENPDEESTGAPDEFMSKTVGQRTAVVFAGPLMNYVLANIILIGVFLFVGKPIVDTEHVVVGMVQSESPAAKAGLQPGDVVISIDGTPIDNFEAMRKLIEPSAEKPLTMTIARGQDTLTATVTPALHTRPNIKGGLDTVGLIGVEQEIIGYNRFGLIESVKRGVVGAHVMVYQTVMFVKMLVAGEVSPRMVGGPLFIAQQSGREASKGPSSLFVFMALLSINLAVLNVLPIPVLDGGHLVFLLIEKIKGSPVTMRARLIAQQVGFVLLLALIVMVTYNDILRLIRGY